MTTNQTVERRDFVARLVAEIPQALIVTGLGSASYDLFAAGERDRNLYLWGAMGGAVPLGLGVALAQPEQSVVVITGDGEHLMGIGSLATVAARQPKNLSIVVLDNGHFGETGMQRSHTSLGTNLTAVAQGFGMPEALAINSVDSIAELATRIRARRAPTYAHVRVAPDEPPRVLPPRDGAYLKNRFRAALGLAPL